MSRYATLLIAALALLGVADAAKADWGNLTYGGFQPWWNPLGIGKRHGQSHEERRLQRFWHDYYDAQRRYYKSLEHLDWVAYYKNHGQQVNGGYGAACANGNCQAPAPIQFAPVTVSPTMSWAVPTGGGAGYAIGAAPVSAANYGYAPNLAPAGYYPQPMGGMYPGYAVPTMPSGPGSPTGYSQGE